MPKGFSEFSEFLRTFLKFMPEEGYLEPSRTSAMHLTSNYCQ